jgi:hypothetical protein
MLIDAKPVSAFTKRAFYLALATLAVSTLAGGASRAGTISCSGLKEQISVNGSYLYRYKDPAKPALSLYTRDVSSSVRLCSVERVSVANLLRSRNFQAAQYPPA